MDNLYNLIGIFVVWGLAGAATVAIAVTLWIGLGALVFSIKVANYLEWKNSKGNKVTFKHVYDFWWHVLEGQHKGLYKAFHKEGYVLYPWPWLLVKDRKKYIEEYESRKRGC